MSLASRLSSVLQRIQSVRTKLVGGENGTVNTKDNEEEVTAGLERETALLTAASPSCAALRQAALHLAAALQQQLPNAPPLDDAMLQQMSFDQLVARVEEMSAQLTGVTTSTQTSQSSQATIHATKPSPTPAAATTQSTASATAAPVTTANTAPTTVPAASTAAPDPASTSTSAPSASTPQATTKSAVTQPAAAAPAPAPAAGAAAAAVPAPASAPASGDVARRSYTYVELKGGRIPGVEWSRRESYLDDNEFQEVFKMNRQDFNKLAQWKRDEKKKAVGLF